MLLRGRKQRISAAGKNSLLYDPRISVLSVPEKFYLDEILLHAIQ